MPDAASSGNGSGNRESKKARQETGPAVPCALCLILASTSAIARWTAADIIISLVSSKSASAAAWSGAAARLLSRSALARRAGSLPQFTLAIVQRPSWACSSVIVSGATSICQKVASGEVPRELSPQEVEEIKTFGQAE